MVNHPHPITVANLRFLADRTIWFPYLQFHKPALPVLGIVANPSIFIPAPRWPMLLPIAKMHLALGHPIFIPVRTPAMELAVFKLPMVFYVSGRIPLIIISMLQTILVVQPRDHSTLLVPACPQVSLHPLVLHRHIETPPSFWEAPNLFQPWGSLYRILRLTQLPPIGFSFFHFCTAS